MKFSTCLVTLGLALGAVSEPLRFAKRDLNAIITLLGSTNENLLKLSELVVAYTGGPATEVFAVSDTIIDQLAEGAALAKAHVPEFSIMDAAKLAGVISGINTNIPPVINALIEKKQVALDNNVAHLVKAAIQAQFDGVGAFGKALYDNAVPQAQIPIGAVQELLIANIQPGIDAYADVTTPTATPTAEPTGEPTATDSTAEPTDEPTGTATGTTAEPTGEPTGTTAEPTAEPTGTDEPCTEEPTASETSGPEPTDGCNGTATVTVTVTECGPGPNPPTPTGTGVTPPSYTVPTPPNPTSPPDSEGGAAMNKAGAMGVVAVVAAVLAF